MPKKYSEEFRKQVVTCFENGQPIDSLCQTHQIAHSTLYRWIKEYQPLVASEKVCSLSEFNTIVRQKERGERLMEIIRLSNIIDDVPLRKRLEILADIHEKFDQYNVHELCDALNVAKGTFYNHIFRKADRSKYLQEQETLMLHVQQVFDDSGQRFGAAKIRAILTENGICASSKRIQNIMHELGLQSVHNDSKRNYKKRQKDKKRNHLNQEFTAARINQTCIRLPGKKNVLPFCSVQQELFKTQRPFQFFVLAVLSVFSVL